MSSLAAAAGKMPQHPRGYIACVEYVAERTPESRVCSLSSRSFPYTWRLSAEYNLHRYLTTLNFKMNT